MTHDLYLFSDDGALASVRCRKCPANANFDLTGMNEPKAIVGAEGELPQLDADDVDKWLGPCSGT